MQKFYQFAIAVSNCCGHTELLHREQLPVGSPIRWVREPLGSQGAMAVGSHHVSAEHQLHTTFVYIKIVTHSLSACNGCQNGCNYRDHTELLHWEQLGSPIRLVREQLGSQGAMAVGSFHASAEYLLQTTLV